MGLRAEPEALHQAGRSADLAGEQAARIKLGEPAGDIAGALPGGKSEGAATRVAQSWQRALTTWSDAATAHGESLAASAKTYERSDSDNARAIDAAGR
ncbi:hypothetical protein E1202_19100 [Saccharopolyspora karakumensis]|uniref:Excreted virulence factor EspC, type VII ESX diderm n=1 Tax=Saccharopolyspora karakumensis TaxID=2530386 RepID=A0A4R5BKN2_9PSEU|nr:hypothetical protein [Saccharopolyspora karakumensis]TDD86259.1 hypothetical protein E1202_19100 [Saccharopolyspora karakumensis]